MVHNVYVCVGRSASGNFRNGLDNRVWGWKSPAGGELATAAFTLA
jgi:hypothetical protein